MKNILDGINTNQIIQRNKSTMWNTGQWKTPQLKNKEKKKTLKNEFRWGHMGKHKVY